MAKCQAVQDAQPGMARSTRRRPSAGEARGTPEFSLCFTHFSGEMSKVFFPEKNGAWICLHFVQVKGPRNFSETWHFSASEKSKKRTVLGQKIGSSVLRIGVSAKSHVNQN